MWCCSQVWRPLWPMIACPVKVGVGGCVSGAKGRGQEANWDLEECQAGGCQHVTHGDTRASVPLPAAADTDPQTWRAPCVRPPPTTFHLCC